MLTWLEDDFRRVPVCESAGTDGDMVWHLRIEMIELKETVIVRLHALGIGKRRAFKSDRSAGNDAVIHIGHRTDDRSSLRFGSGDEMLGYRCTGDRNTEKKAKQVMLYTQLPPPVVFRIVLVKVLDSSRAARVLWTFSAHFFLSRCTTLPLRVNAVCESSLRRH